jgi:peptide/nickel transport system permease protein
VALLVAGSGLGLLAVGAILAPVLSGIDPNLVDLGGRLHGPSAGHPLGQDALGRDVLARLLHGARISLGVGALSVLLALLLGTALGTLAGLRGGWLDEGLTRLIDVLLAFPGLLLAIALAAVLGPSVRNVVFALVLLGWTSYARLVRAEVSSVRRRAFVEAARALGTRPLALAMRHLLPAVLPSLTVQATFGLSGAIVAEASLSFLGLGAPPPAPSWGAMLDEGRAFLLVAPRAILVPGAALAGTVLLLQLAGDGLRDLLDVRSDPLQR